MFSFDEIKKFIAKYQPDGIIIDTNLLILFLVGSFDQDYIKAYKLLNNNNKETSIEDFELLKNILDLFKKLIITPQVIAELSNLSITKGGIQKDRLPAYLRTVIAFLKSSEERHQKTDCLWGLGMKVLSDYGLTDLTMFELSRQTGMPIITDDFPFWHYSYGKIPIIKFQDIKNQSYQSIFK